MCAARTHMCHHGTRSIYLLVRPSTCSRSHDSEIAMCGGEGGNLDTCASKGWFLRGMAARFSSFFIFQRFFRQVAKVTFVRE
jgi:hypothetical protein